MATDERMSPVRQGAMATGFASWGMTGGTAAALLCAELALGRDSPWSSFFDPNRLTVRASVSRLVTENAVIALRFLGCRVACIRAERSWDRPCHGSRFSPTGDVLQGPAVHRLERRPVG